MHNSLKYVTVSLLGFFAASVFLSSALSPTLSAVWAGTTIDLNKAGVEQLAKLEDAGFPAGLDKAIAQRRTELGGFKSPEDVRSVPGMTDEMFTLLFPFELNGSIVVEVDMPPSMASY